MHVLNIYESACLSASLAEMGTIGLLLCDKIPPLCVCARTCVFSLLHSLER